MQSILIKIYNIYDLTSAYIIIDVIFFCQLLTGSEILVTILSLIACRKLTFSGLVVECESFLTLIAKSSGSILIENAVSAEFRAFFALRSHHGWSHRSLSFAYLHFLGKASIICKQMLNVGTLLAIRVAIAKVVTFNISKTLLTGDALVRSVTT